MILPALERLVRQMERTIRHFALNFDNARVEKIYVSSGIQPHPRILDYIGEELGLPIEEFNPFAPAEGFQSLPVPPESASEKGSYAPALGMALAANAITPNFLYTHKNKNKDLNTRRINRGVFACFFLLILCWAVAGTVILLGSVYTFGSRDIPAPQATLMKTIVEGVLAGALPWGLVLSGAGLAITALLCSISPLAFAIGVYLPLATMAAIFVGGCVRALAERGSQPGEKKAEADPGILAASGLVAGEGLAGVLVAGLVAAQVVPRSMSPRLPGLAGEIALVVLVIGICVFLYRAGRKPE